ncbi:MAG: hypothetical protein ACXU9S_09840 [Gemmatimonadaceae bacterium]
MTIGSEPINLVGHTTFVEGGSDLRFRIRRLNADYRRSRRGEYEQPRLVEQNN